MAGFQKLIIDGKEVAKLVIDGKQCFPLILKRNLTVSVSIMESAPGLLKLELTPQYDGPRITLDTSMIYQRPDYSLPAEVSATYVVSADGTSFYATYITELHGYEAAPVISLPACDGYEADEWAASSGPYWIPENVKRSRDLIVNVTKVRDTYGQLELRVDLDYIGPEVILNSNVIDVDGYMERPPELTINIAGYSATITVYNNDVSDCAFDLVVNLPEADGFLAANWSAPYIVQGIQAEERTITGIYITDYVYEAVESSGTSVYPTWTKYKVSIEYRHIYSDGYDDGRRYNDVVYATTNDNEKTTLTYSDPYDGYTATYVILR